MNLQTFASSDDRFTRRYVYDDVIVVAADLDFTDAHVDVVDDTVIVVGPENEQFELDTEGTPTLAFMRNGILTIEMEANQ